jgi:hypothetical protein
MKLMVRNTLSGLVPLYPSDFEEKRKLKLNEDYEVEIKRPRNVLFHRKFFAMLKVGHENTQLEMPFDTYRRYVTMKAGFFKTYYTPKGVLYEAESIAFGNMDETTFEDVYSRVLNVVIKDIGVTAEDVEHEILNYF